VKDLPGWISAIAAALSTIAGFLALWSNRRSKKAITISERAALAAERSANAAEKSAAVSEASAAAAQASLRIEGERRHQELAPLFDLKGELIKEGSRNVRALWLTFRGPQDSLDELRVQFDPPIGQEPHCVEQIIVGDHETLRPGEEMQKGFPLRRDDKFSVRIQLKDPTAFGAVIRLRLHCRVGDETWTVTRQGHGPCTLRL
jgi:hypothetical protein